MFGSEVLTHWLPVSVKPADFRLQTAGHKWWTSENERHLIFMTIDQAERSYLWFHKYFYCRLSSYIILQSYIFIQRGERREERPKWALSLQIIADDDEKCKILAKSASLFLVYYFANDCNDAVNRLGYIFMIYILYHRLICFSSYNTITESGRQLSQIIKISFSRSQASSLVIRAHSVHESKVYCFFFQIPLKRLLKRNFFSVESAISWAKEESLVVLDLPRYSEKLQRVTACAKYC